ncbi:MAG: hypothetical protein VX899_10705 [Myxococcota bacterium]|nr:hypothetical protein [Myxococcota bacterium]
MLLLTRGVGRRSDSGTQALNAYLDSPLKAQGGHLMGREALNAVLFPQS